MSGLRYRLTFRTAGGVSSGLGIAGLLDRQMLRGADGAPLVPGSSVKGRWRFFAERLMRTLGTVESLTLHAPDQPCPSARGACAVCTLFGSARVPALVLFGDARPVSAQAAAALRARSISTVLPGDSEVRPGVAIGRARRTALADRFFYEEAIPPTVYEGALRLRGRALGEAERRLLIASGRLVDALGARKAVGRGALESGIEWVGPESAT